MTVSRPSRGDVWGPQDPDEQCEWLVVSSDAWNRSAVDEVLALAVVRGEDDAGVYTPMAVVDGDVVTVWADTIVRVPVDGLDELMWRAPDGLMELVGEALDDALREQPAEPGLPRPASFPGQGQFRHADLNIPGDGPKPVVVVSSDRFAQENGFEYVIVVRKTSSQGPARTFEVPLLTHGGGKAVCSDVRTIRAAALSSRRFDKQVTAPEAAAITAAVRLMLGLPGADHK